jgi:hypothetical protein
VRRSARWRPRDGGPGAFSGPERAGDTVRGLWNESSALKPQPHLAVQCWFFAPGTYAVMIARQGKAGWAMARRCWAGAWPGGALL